VKRLSRRRHPHSDSNIPTVGLARALSKLGYCSRAQAFDLIRSARVRLNGSIRRNPETPVHLSKDRIEVDGRLVVEASKTYLMLNKPRGVVTTASDEKGRDTVYSCLRPDLPWVAPVGRLDKASEGLLFLTNDTVWSARVLAPETHLNKTYHVQIGRIADAELLNSLLKGPPGREGETLRIKRASLLRCGERNSWLEIILDEGKNRHIRRVFDSLGIEVLRLVRVAIGPLALGDLLKGAFRPLTATEKLSLDGAMNALRDC
jgi:23S rRNA pseudouridine2605 synthase